MRITHWFGLAVAATLLTGCATENKSTDQAAKADQPFIINIAGPLSDPFFGAVKQGSDAAAKELGINYQYSASKDFNDIVAIYTRLTEAAIGRHPDALVIGDYFPDALDPLIKKAVAQGIPVIVTNSGRNNWRANGAIAFVGEDSLAMGQAAGDKAVESGVTLGICVNHVAGNPTLEQRCLGYAEKIKAKGGKVVNLTIPSEDSGNDQKIQQAIAGALQANKGVNGVFTLGASVAVDAVAAAKQAGLDGKITIGTTDLSKAALNAVKAGELSFVLDQQPFLQGYYGLLIAQQYLRYGLRPTAEVTTGPLLITKDNVDSVLKVGDTYPGVRGAA